MNSNRQEKLNQRTLLAAAVLIICGAAGIYFSKQNWLKEVFISVLASGIVTSVMSILTDRIEINPLDQWCIKNVYQSRQIMNADCDEIIKKAKNQIDVVAFGLKHFREEVDVESMLKKGVKFRIITMNPESEFVRQREMEEGKDEGYIQESIYDLVKWADDLNRRTYRGKIEVKGYSCMTLDFYWRVDDTIFSGPYWYDYDSQATVSYSFGSGRTFDIYSQYFEKLWNNDKIMKTMTKTSRK